MIFGRFWLISSLLMGAGRGALQELPERGVGRKLERKMCPLTPTTEPSDIGSGQWPDPLFFVGVGLLLLLSWVFIGFWRNHGGYHARMCKQTTPLG